VITLSASQADFLQAQVPLKVLFARKEALLPQGEALDARLGGLLRRALAGAARARSCTEGRVTARNAASRRDGQVVEASLDRAR
jgi:hypothetical protein